MGKKALGKGFDELVGSSISDKSLAEVLGQANRQQSILEVDLKSIKPSADQPRKKFNDAATDELAQSIKEHGVLQPIIVVEEDQGYTIVSGERRYRAAGKAKLTTVPVVVRSMNEQQRLEVGLVENIQREDLSILDMAIALKSLMDNFNLSQAEVGKKVGKEPSTVGNLIRLTTLSDKTRTMLADGSLSEGHARQLIGLEPKQQQRIIKMIFDKGWTIRQTESFVRALKQSANTKEEDSKKQAEAMTKNQNATTKALEARLKLPVTISPMARGGKLVIRYKDDADLDKIKKSFAA